MKGKGKNFSSSYDTARHHFDSRVKRRRRCGGERGRELRLFRIKTTIKMKRTERVELDPFIFSLCVHNIMYGVSNWWGHINKMLRIFFMDQERVKKIGYILHVNAEHETQDLSSSQLSLHMKYERRDNLFCTLKFRAGLSGIWFDLIFSSSLVP